jgi:hypothetical protein
VPEAHVAVGPAGRVEDQRRLLLGVLAGVERALAGAVFEDAAERVGEAALGQHFALAALVEDRLEVVAEPLDQAEVALVDAAGRFEGGAQALGRGAAGAQRGEGGDAELVGQQLGQGGADLLLADPAAVQGHPREASRGGQLFDPQFVPAPGAELVADSFQPLSFDLRSHLLHQRITR